MKIFSILSGIIVVILGVGYVATNSSTPTQITTPKTPAEHTTLTTSTDGMPEATASTVSENTPSTTTSVDSGTGLYAPYDAETIAQSDADHIFLFFHATWCPSCKTLEADIVANKDKIPSNVEIYKVDYDTATDLKRKYGITTQHSVIEIATSGEAESNISHPPTLDALLTTI